MTGEKGNAIFFGVVAILFGYKAFTQNWLPLIEGKNIVGGGAKVIGVCCIILGLIMILWAIAKIYM